MFPRTSELRIAAKSFLKTHLAAFTDIWRNMWILRHDLVIPEDGSVVYEQPLCMPLQDALVNLVTMLQVSLDDKPE